VDGDQLHGAAHLRITVEEGQRRRGGLAVFIIIVVVQLRNNVKVFDV
jgi:hypothetical protein